MRMRLSDRSSNGSEAATGCVRVARDHGLDAMPHHLGQVGVADARLSKIRDVAVAALMRSNVEAGSFLGGFPNVAVEGALTPEAASGS